MTATSTPRFAANVQRCREAARDLLAPGERAPPTAVDVTEDDPRLATPDEWRFAWSVVAHGFDPRCAAHLGAALGPASRAGLSVAQHAVMWNLSDDATARVMSALISHRPMRRLGLLLPQEDQILDVNTPWRAPVRAWNYLRGVAECDPLVQSYGGVLRGDARAITSAEQREVQVRIAGWIASNDPVTIVLTGAAGGGRKTALAQAVAPRAVVFADFRRVPAKLAIEVMIAVEREANLLDAVPVLDHLDALWSRLDTSELQLVIASRVAEIAGPIVITAGSTGLDLVAGARTRLQQSWPLPDGPTRRAMWAAIGAGALTDRELELVADRYAFGAGAIAASSRSAGRHATSNGRAAPTFTDVVAGVRDNIAERLGEVARRVEVGQSWDELVLSPETRDDVTALVNRVKYGHKVLDTWGFRSKLPRGSGTAALFSGPPGTGKTMVAGLIARELELELYQIDLSKIVSKWVGETEKQLARVFEAAEAGHALLLFDEADALFAKRSAEVKSAVDRYANLEVNYLLQRVESFGGVVILTTNLDASIDPALRRRLAAHITFGAPEIDERRRLWTQMLTSNAPTEGDLDVEELAQEFEDMTGANIRNAVLAGAFLAAGENVAISAEHLRRGAHGEYRAMGRVLSRGKAR